MGGYGVYGLGTISTINQKGWRVKPHWYLGGCEGQVTGHRSQVIGHRGSGGEGE